MKPEAIIFLACFVVVMFVVIEDFYPRRRRQEPQAQKQKWTGRCLDCNKRLPFDEHEEEQDELCRRCGDARAERKRKEGK